MARPKKALEVVREAEQEPKEKPKKTTVKKADKRSVKKAEAKIKNDVAYDPSNVEYLADCVVNNPALINQFEALGFRSQNPDGMTFREAMMCSQIASAVKGDIKAYRAVMDYAEEKRMRPLERLAKDDLRKKPINKLK
jgi:hypothetical protein